MGPVLGVRLGVGTCLHPVASHGAGFQLELWCLPCGPLCLSTNRATLESCPHCAELGVQS